MKLRKMSQAKSELISEQQIQDAYYNIKDTVIQTPLQEHPGLSAKYDCTLTIKREDMQIVRSFKIRGAYHKMKLLQSKLDTFEVICASAGNHAQGFAFACAHLKIKGTVYMPNPTPKQKIEKVKFFGKEWVEIKLTGDSFDDAYTAAYDEQQKTGHIFIHPFDDLDIIAGQGTIGAEIIKQTKTPIDYLFIAVGGGGLLSGVGSYFKAASPNTKIIAVESVGAPALHQSLKENKRVILDKIDTFADGIAVKTVGEKCFTIAQTIVDDSILIPEGKICTTILKLYNDDAIVAEPAGAISIAALDFFKHEIKGKQVCVILCGGNNDITRTEEIRERSLLYEGKKHYFIINFPQRAGALKEFLNTLGPNDDITHFEYTKKHNRECGPALVGIELKHADDYANLVANMNSMSLQYEHINDKPLLFDMLV